MKYGFGNVVFGRVLLWFGVVRYSVVVSGNVRVL